MIVKEERRDARLAGKNLVLHTCIHVREYFSSLSVRDLSRGRVSVAHDLNHEFNYFRVTETRRVCKMPPRVIFSFFFFLSLAIPRNQSRVIDPVYPPLLAIISPGRYTAPVYISCAASVMQGIGERLNDNSPSRL